MIANRTLLQMKYARIVEGFANRMGITLDDALAFFYSSDTYVLMNEGVGDMHARSDGYLVDELSFEWERKATSPVGNGR